MEELKEEIKVSNKPNINIENSNNYIYNQYILIYMR